MVRKLAAPSLVLVLALVLLWPGTVLAAPPGWTVSQVTSGDVNCTNPEISGARVVWRVNNPPSQVFTALIGEMSATQVSSGSFNDWQSVSGDRVAWGAYDGVNFVVRTWKPDDGATTLTTDTSAQTWADMSAVSGDRVVWVAHGVPYDTIGTWEAGDTTASTIGTLGFQKYDPQVSGDRVVWYGSDGSNYQVYTWKAGSAEEQLTSEPTDHGGVHVDGDRAVWFGADAGSAYHIYEQDLALDSQPTTIADVPTSDSIPLVSGTRVVWEARVGGADQVFLWKLGDAAPTRIATSTQEQSDPQISGDRVVWTGSDGTNDQIVTWKIGDSAPTTLTSDAQIHGHARVSGDRVVWEAIDSHGTTHIFAALFAPAAKTALTKPTVSPSKPTHQRTVTFTAYLTPASARGTAAMTLSLLHLEKKWVTKVVNGVSKRVRVSYWRARGTFAMSAATVGTRARLTKKVKLAYTGSWRASVRYAGCAAYQACGSSTLSFAVK